MARGIQNFLQYCQRSYLARFNCIVFSCGVFSCFGPHCQTNLLSALCWSDGQSVCVVFKLLHQQCRMSSFLIAALLSQSSVCFAHGVLCKGSPVLPWTSTCMVWLPSKSLFAFAFASHSAQRPGCGTFSDTSFALLN